MLYLWVISTCWSHSARTSKFHLVVLCEVSDVDLICVAQHKHNILSECREGMRNFMYVPWKNPSFCLNISCRNIVFTVMLKFKWNLSPTLAVFSTNSLLWHSPCYLARYVLSMSSLENFWTHRVAVILSGIWHCLGLTNYSSEVAIVMVQQHISCRIILCEYRLLMLIRKTRV